MQIESSPPPLLLSDDDENKSGNRLEVIESKLDFKKLSERGEKHKPSSSKL